MATETMTCQETTANMYRKAVNACIRQGTIPTSYSTHISVLKDKEGDHGVRINKSPNVTKAYEIFYFSLQ